jgi:glucosamine--fructose-6-phosphate aminotransferase (isomerizing)
MCGIVGYIGQKSSVDVVLAGLQALEYRGYDSAGIALINGKDELLIKQVGRVEGLRKAIEESEATSAPLAIGHTRWATHGSPTLQNAHPHTNTDKTIFVVHNGIIENYAELRQELQKQGYEFVSETDTEVIPHLIDYYYKKSQDFDLAFK